MILTPKPNSTESSTELALDPSDLDTAIVLDADGDEDDSLAPIELELTPDACGQRLDKVISGLVPQFSRGRLQMWITDGFVSVDGKPAKSTKDTVYGDEKIVILPQPAPEDEAFKPEQVELNIVFEDDHLIVINKPAGLVVHPGAATGAARCSTACCSTARNWPACRAPASSTASTRTPAA